MELIDKCRNERKQTFHSVGIIDFIKLKGVVEHNHSNGDDPDLVRHSTTRFRTKTLGFLVISSVSWGCEVGNEMCSKH